MTDVLALPNMLLMRLGRCSGAALVLVLAACQSTRHAPPQISSSATVLPMPVVEQDELYECGLSSISGLCAFWQHALPDDERAELAKMAAERKGLSGAELREALEKNGFEVFVFSGTIDDSNTGLLHHLEAGRPLIVMTSEHGSNHYSLFVGHDPELGNVLLVDPKRGFIALPQPVFERLWTEAARFTLLATPRDEPRTPGSAGEHGR